MQENQKILLETGTNEFEVVEFLVGSVAYGINVAKVREVINAVPVTQMPNAHSYVDGVFTLRGRLMPLVNLARCLGSATETDKAKIIVSEINGMFAGFKVDEVSRIHRISWTQMEPAPSITNSELVVGIVKMPDKIMLLLDFEKILSEINPEINQKLTAIPTVSADLLHKRGSKSILVAEDSRMLRDLLISTLHAAGYTQTIATQNGKEAWEELGKILANAEPVEDQLQLVITDIEMPQMDGHHLTRLIKDHNSLKALPVVIFSSLINEEMRRKGESIGVAAQITKPEISQLIDMLDRILL